MNQNYIIFKEKDLTSLDPKLLKYENTLNHSGISGFSYDGKKVYIQAPLTRIQRLQENIIIFDFSPEFKESLKIFNLKGLELGYHYIYTNFDVIDSTDIEVFNINGSTYTEKLEINDTGYVLLVPLKFLPFKNPGSNMVIHYLPWMAIQLKLSNRSHRFTECVLKDDD